MGYLKEEDVNGQFDSNTEEAVKAFQKDNKLTADGVVGEKTLKKMFDPEAKHAGEKAPAQKETKPKSNNTKPSSNKNNSSQETSTQKNEAEATEEVIF